MHSGKEQFIYSYTQLNTIESACKHNLWIYFGEFIAVQTIKNMEKMNNNCKKHFSMQNDGQGTMPTLQQLKNTTIKKTITITPQSEQRTRTKGKKLWEKY